MSAFEIVIRDVLDAQVPLRLEQAPDWNDVLGRAGARGTAPRVLHAADPPRSARARWTPRRRRVLFALVATVLAVIVVGSALAALGQNPFGTLTSWLSGSPGKPASASVQAGFAARNGSSYASFPSRTRLRLLTHVTVAGRDYSLVGFRNGHSLCLRLVPSASPGWRGINQCVTVRELQRSSAPALVASTASFARESGYASGIFGFADDTVRAVRVVHSLGGRQTVRVRNNVFLVLAGSPPTAIYDPIVQIRALTRSGRGVVVPFAFQGVVPLPATPSYLRRTRIVLPGPKRVEARLSSATIGWVDRRELRGEPFAPQLRGFDSPSTRAVYSRRIQPDPDDPYRMGLWVVRVGAVSRASIAAGPAWGKVLRLRTGEELLCHAGLFPLRPPPIGYLCSPTTTSSTLFEPGHVLTVERTYREAFTRVAGLAADGVSGIDLYLAGGRVIPAVLHDNAYTVEGPSDQWPAKLVAYDARGHVVEIDVIDPQGSKAVLTPCPAATAASGAAGGAVRSWERIDLDRWTVGGRRILGRSVAEVQSALGPPAARHGDALLYGASLGGRAPLTISFDRTRSGLRAAWLEYRDPRVVDSRLGRVLMLQPPELQRSLARSDSGYVSRFTYGSEPALLGCTAVFRSPDGKRELSFGLDPDHPAQPFIRLSAPASQLP